MNDKFKITYCQSKIDWIKNINKYYSLIIDWKEEAKAIAKAVNWIITIIK